MGKKSTLSALCITSLASLAIVTACGDKPEPKPAPQPTATAETPSQPEGQGGAGVGQGEGGKAEKPTVEEPATRRVRPAAIYGPKNRISTTFGVTPGSTLRLTGGYTFKIQELSLPGGINITFELTKKGKSKGSAVGKILFLATQWGHKKRFSNIKSEGPPFEFYFPTKGKDSINLAVGWVELGPQGHPTSKVKEWDIYPPTRIDTGLKEAYFELKEIGPCFMHATTRDATVKDSSATDAAPAP